MAEQARGLTRERRDASMVSFRGWSIDGFMGS
jgi:hypothetical protein